MTEIHIIRRLLAGVLLILFAFSITPKKALHDAITNHKDTHFKKNTSNEEQVGKDGFNCKCDYLVAESPFTEQENHFELAVFKLFPAQKEITLYSCYTSPRFFFELRGPPAVC